MIQIQEAKVLQVVAFDETQAPITANPDWWNVAIDNKTGILSLKKDKISCVYNLGLHTLCLTQVDAKEKAAIGKTLGRMALTGIAFSVLRDGRKGSGTGGALLDLSLRGAETTSVISAYLVLSDTTTIQLELDEGAYRTLMGLVPSYALSPDALDRAKDLFDLVKRMVLDGERVLPEIDAKISNLVPRMNTLKKIVEIGGTFEQRDGARQEGQSIFLEIENQMNLKKAVEYQIRSAQVLSKEPVQNSSSFDTKPFTKNEKFAYLMIFLFLLGIFVIMLVLPARP